MVPEGPGCRLQRGTPASQGPTRAPGGKNVLDEGFQQGAQGHRLGLINNALRGVQGIVHTLQMRVPLHHREESHGTDVRSAELNQSIRTSRSTTKPQGGNLSAQGVQ